MMISLELSSQLLQLLLQVDPRSHKMFTTKMVLKPNFRNIHNMYETSNMKKGGIKKEIRQLA